MTAFDQAKINHRRARILASKRLFDVFASATALILLSPVFVITSLVILGFSRPGPIIFRHLRIGKDGEPFELLKFRTMAPSKGPSITVKGDPRVTRVGRFLRKYKIDELPQLWNVLVGDMSLVGPRPEVPEIVEDFKIEFEPLLSVRPGITDEASLRFADEESILGRFEDPQEAYRTIILPLKLELSKKYVKDPSIIADLSIVLRTIKRIVSK